MRCHGGCTCNSIGLAARTVVLEDAGEARRVARHTRTGKRAILGLQEAKRPARCCATPHRARGDFLSQLSSELAMELSSELAMDQAVRLGRRREG